MNELNILNKCFFKPKSCCNIILWFVSMIYIYYSYEPLKRRTGFHLKRFSNMKVKNRTEVNKDVWAFNTWQQTHEVPDSTQINILSVVKFVLVEMSAVCCLQCFSAQEPDLNINRERGSVQGPDPLLLHERKRREEDVWLLHRHCARFSPGLLFGPILLLVVSLMFTLWPQTFPVMFFSFQVQFTA